METEEEKLVCVICCEEFIMNKSRGFRKRKNGTKVQSLKQFCEEILVGVEKKLELEENTGLLFESSQKGQNRGAGVRPGKRSRRRRKKGLGGNKRKQNFGGEDGQVKEEVDEEEDEIEEDDDDGDIPIFRTNLEAKLVQFLDNPDDNLTICGKCVEMMNTVTEARLSVKPVEERVEKLQMLLLREMGRLARKMEGVWREFEVIEETMLSGDFKLMERNLDECYSRKEGGKQKIWGKISEEHTERRQEIRGFRGKICDVLSGLEKYGFEVRQKHIHKPAVRSQPKGKKAAAGAYQEISPPFVEVKIEVDNPTEEEPSSPYHLAESLLPPVPGYGDHDDDIEEPMDLDEFNEHLTDEDDCEEEPVENEDKDDNMSRASISEEEKKEESEDDDDDYYNPIHKASYSEGLFTHLDFHLSKMSPFKCNLVKSVLKIQNSNWYQKTRKSLKKPPTNSKSKDTDAQEPPPPPLPLPTPLRQHMSQLSYHLERKLIYLSGIPIKILCKAEDPSLQENGLLCTKCNFTAPESSSGMKTKMYDHILSKHLNAYQCPHCEDYMETDLEYRKHLKICRGESKKVECDICGKTLSEKKSLEGHKWLHMNEEERKEAIDKGLLKKDPREMKNRKNVPKLHQCEKCGKGFPWKAELLQHEIIHKDKSEREQSMCPKCGKCFLRAGLEYHRKYSDTCAEEPIKKQSCLECGKKFKNKYILRKHRILQHGEKSGERPFVCGTCGKGFKMKRGLNVHEIIHRGDKPFKCRVCGMGFSHSGNMKRHEQKCEQ